MGYPTVTVEIAFATDPLATPTWTDVSDYFRGGRWNHGRAHERATFEPGTAEVVLTNTDRRFDPLHASGPYYGDLLPNRRIRITATWDATTYDCWYGFVDEWRQDPRGGVCVVTATDAFKMLAGIPQPESVWAAEIAQNTPKAWYSFRSDGNETVIDRTGNDHNATLPDPVSSMSADTLIAGAPNTAVTFPAGVGMRIPSSAFPDVTAYTIEFWVHLSFADLADATYLLWSPDQAFAVWVNYTGLGDLRWKSADPPAVDVESGTVPLKAGRPNHVALVRDGSTVYLYLNGVDVSTNRTGTPSGTATRDLVYGPFGADIGLTVDDLVIHTEALDATTIADHYTAGVDAWDGDDTGDRAVNLLTAVDWPTALRDIDTGQSTFVLGAAALGDGSVLDYLQTLAATEQGMLFADARNGGKVTLLQRGALLADTRHTTSQATFSDDPAASPAYRYTDVELVYDDSLIFNDVTVTFIGGQVTATDATSITTYGRRSLTVDTVLTNDLDALALAEWLIARHKDPRIWVRGLRLNPAADNRLWPQALGRKVGDRVTLTHTPYGTGSAISEELWVTSISHDVGVDEGIDRWDTILGLTPVEDADGYWVWGSSTWDVDTRWGL